MVVDLGQQGVAAGGEQQQERRLQRIGVEVQRGDVAVQVPDRDQRQAAGIGQRLRARQPDQKRSDQAGPSVTAIASISSNVTPASLSARSITGTHSSR